MGVPGGFGTSIAAQLSPQGTTFFGFDGSTRLGFRSRR